jgi:hypothetical protein
MRIMTLFVPEKFFLFNPSSTTFVKHFISRMQQMAYNNASADTYVAGYGNTTSAIDGFNLRWQVVI